MRVFTVFCMCASQPHKVSFEDIEHEMDGGVVESPFTFIQNMLYYRERAAARIQFSFMCYVISRHSHGEVVTRVRICICYALAFSYPLLFLACLLSHSIWSEYPNPKPYMNGV